MDVLQLLDDELKAKTNWGLKQKLRYLYLRSCMLFSYDERYRSKLYKSVHPRDEITINIVLREIDLRNVDNFLVVCTSFSRYVYKRIVKELLGIEVSLCGDGHEYNMFLFDESRFMADVTNKCDLERVKMGMKTEGYYDYDIGRSLTDKRVKQTDKEIGYIKDEYFEEILKRRINNLEWEYYDKTGKCYSYDNKTDYFLFQMRIVKEIFDKLNIFKYYSDAFYCEEILLSEFFKDCSCKLTNNNLVDITSNDIWNFINVLDIDYNGEKFNFVLEPINGKYEFHEISVNEGDYYKKELRSSSF